MPRAKYRQYRGRSSRPFKLSDDLAIWEGPVPEDAVDVSYTLQNAVDDLISRGCLDCAPATVVHYRKKAGHLIRVMGSDLALSRITIGMARGYIRTRQEEGAMDITIKKELIAYRRALKLAFEEGNLRTNPQELVPRFRVRYIPRERWLSAEQMERLLSKLPPKRRLWVLIASFAGARFSEVERLCWENVDFEMGWVLLPGTKTAKSRRRVPMAPILADALREVAASSGPVVETWTSVRRDLHVACRRADIPLVTPNDLRRTFASWLKQAGNESMVVAKLLGHTTSRMVELVYGHLSTKEYVTAIADLPTLRMTATPASSEGDAAPSQGSATPLEAPPAAAIAFAQVP